MSKLNPDLSEDYCINDRGELVAIRNQNYPITGVKEYSFGLLHLSIMPGIRNR